MLISIHRGEMDFKLAKERKFSFDELMTSIILKIVEHKKGNIQNRVRFNSELSNRIKAFLKNPQLHDGSRIEKCSG